MHLDFQFVEQQYSTVTTGHAIPQRLRQVHQAPAQFFIAISGFKDTPDALREIQAIGGKVLGVLQLRENVRKVMGGVLLHQGTPHLMLFRIGCHPGKPSRFLCLR
ncbi:hypothetical protein D3C75_1122220 [compost metagenome]